jgi:hypothetical protein
MISHRIYQIAAVGSLAVLLTACGGGSNSSPVSPLTSTNKQAFAAAYNSGLGALGSYAGLTNASFLDLFDGTFLDAGYAKTDVAANLAQESAAMAIAPDLSLYPMASLSGVSIDACDANNVCTLTGTLTNSDADTTSVTFTTQVKISDGKVRLYGDQLSS